MNATTDISISMSTPNKTPLINKILVVVAMMTVIGGSLIGLMTYINMGYSETFFNDWLTSFLLSAVTVMPAGFLLMTLLSNLVQKLLPNTDDKKRNIIIGLCMALIMESAMALSTAINNIGFGNPPELFNAWFSALFAALPLGLTLMIITSLTIKPKIELYLKS